MNEKKKFRRELLIVSLLSAVIVLAVTAGLGTMFSGWHLIDDHEYLRIMGRVGEGETWWEVWLSYLEMDMSVRYCPLYYTLRFLEIYFLRDRIMLYGVLKSVETICALILLYYLGRSLKASVGTSYLFSLLSMTGYQAAVWWKLGPQEVQCVICFSLGMILLIRWVEKQCRLCGWGSLLSFLLMIHLKESFLILVPFIICFLLYLDYRDIGSCREILKQRGRLKKRAVYILILLADLAGIAAVILFAVDANGYTGAGLTFSPKILIQSYKYAFEHDLKYLHAAGMLLSAVLLTYWEELKKMYRELILLAVFLLPQLDVFGKEPMSERYIIPSVIGFMMFYVIAVENRGFLKGGRKWFYRCVLLGLLLLGIRTTCIEADYYRFRGQSVTAAMKMAEKAGKEGHMIMSCMGYSNPEADVMVRNWMEYYEAGGFCYWDEGQDKISHNLPFHKIEEEEDLRLEQVDLVIAYNSKDRHYTGDCRLVREELLEDFERVPCGSLDLYIRRNCGLERQDIMIRNSFYM